MKKIAIVLIITLILGGCGSESTEIDIERTSSIIEESLSDMENVDESSLTDVYGINLDIVSEYVIKLNADGDLYVILKTSDKVETKDDMDNYFERIKEFNTAYSPERLEILENRLEKEVGDYLIYIVAEDAEDIYQDVLDGMN